MRVCSSAMDTEFTLITGASSGLGLEMSRLLAAEGRNLMILARREERLAEIAEELSASGAGEVRSFAVDLSDTKALEAFLASIARDELKIGTLINNAGFGLRGSFAELGCEDQLRCIDLNIRALTRLTHAVLPGMRVRGRGAILNVASTAAFQAGPGMAVYYASKAYVLSFTEALAQELRGQGIHVTCLCPGPTDTEFAQVAGMADSPLFRSGAMDATLVSRQGLRALQRGQVIHLPGMRNKTLAFLLRFTPRSWVRSLVARLQ